MVMPRAFSSGAASIWSYALASPPNLLAQHRRDRRRQRRLAMVHVPDRAHVHVRLGPLEFAFCHFATPNDLDEHAAQALDRLQSTASPATLVPMARIERATSPLPRECSTTEPHGLNVETRPQSDKARRRDSNDCRTGAGDGNRTRVISLEG